MDTHSAYSHKAKKYSRYRWDYHPEAIQAIFDTTRISSQSSVADIGAGTGKLTKHFVGKVAQVFAVEPNSDMRQVAARKLGSPPSCSVIEGQAEATTLSDSSIDLIAVGQALHWFDPEPTRKEFLRILKPDGWLAALWNWATDYAVIDALWKRLIEEKGLDTSRARQPEGRPVKFYFGGDYFRKWTFPFTTQQTWERFIGALSSFAYAPDEGTPLYENFERAARRVFSSFSSNGLMEVHGVTELYLGQIARP
ncbi:MAG: class I SAM-dependent methyltransferase [Dehalococcoidia bacterium]|nr:class I SAM-dependent methyltransferase [Dehalococcoidia bacterium]